MIEIKTLVEGFTIELSTTKDEGKTVGRIAIKINGHEQESVLVTNDNVRELIRALDELSMGIAFD